MTIVEVRWNDRFHMAFEADDVQHGADYLWVSEANKDPKFIPLSSVRWFSKKVA